MSMKIVAVAVFLAFIPMNVWAAEADKAAPVSGESKTGNQPGASYFQGTWVGYWEGFNEPTRQDIKVEIGKEVGDKSYEVTYSWDMVTWKRGITPAGEIKTVGKDQGDTFVFRFKRKKGKQTQEITLTKEKENVVKARLEKMGDIGVQERPSNETYLNRK
jgi:hypothetical protein